MKIGIFDSGVGGLTNLFELEKNYPNHYIYVADQHNNPYGVKSKSQLLEYTSKIIHFLVNQGCTLIIIACNTVCANVLDDLIVLFPNVKFIGVIKPTVDIINRSSYQTILLIATPATIQSKAYLLNNNKFIIELPTAEFVPAIESMDEVLVQSAIQKYLAPYKHKVDAICLGCTHYPLIKKQIKDYLNVDTIDSVQALNNIALPISELKLDFYTTADPNYMQQQVKKLFQREIKVGKLEECNESYYIK